MMEGDNIDEEGTGRFRRYASIENHNNAQMLQWIAEQGKSEGEWVVTEKVHGANLCLLTSNGVDVMAARRNDILKPTGDVPNPPSSISRFASLIRCIL